MSIKQHLQTLHSVGELRQRYGRVKRTSWTPYLGLVVNPLLLWTTRYMDTALNHLRATGAEVRKEDLARHSPLSHKHFIMLGRYHFAVPEKVVRGELRPLRDSNECVTTAARGYYYKRPFRGHFPHRRPLLRCGMRSCFHCSAM